MGSNLGISDGVRAAYRPVLRGARSRLPFGDTRKEGKRLHAAVAARAVARAGPRAGCRWLGAQRDPRRPGMPRRGYLDKLEEFSGNRLAKVLVGQRRTGKSYLLK